MLGAKVFISYKRDHEPTRLVREVVEATLRHKGYEPLVDHEMTGGQRWPRKLYEWARDCSAAVVLASPEAKKSDWCRREWTLLAAREATVDLPVVPVCIGLERRQLGVFSHIEPLDGMELGLLPEELLKALGELKPWRVTSKDYLALHAGWNAYQYEDEPVLSNHGLVLAESYIDTECGVLPWSEIGSGASIKQDPFDEEAGGRQDLLEAVLKKLEDTTLREPIVIQGPAGAGKSAFTVRLVDALKAKGLVPIRIRFRDMRLAQYDRVDEMLAAAVRIGPIDEDTPPPPSDLLSDDRLRTTDECGLGISSTVLILDGWDEVSLAGNAGYSAQLSTWLPKIREFICGRTGSPVRLIVTGRPSLEVKDSGFLTSSTPVLTLRPIRPQQLEWFATTLARQTKWGLQAEHYQPLLDQYRRHVDDGQASGVEMLGLPLLAFLALRTVADYEGDIDQLVSSKTALYQALIDQTVKHAGKASDEGIRGVHRSEGLRALLMRTAAIVSVFWSERISFEELDARLEGDQALMEWVNRATGGDTLYQLVVNFYFKGGHVDLGCEFLHKSFREYLFAEAVLQELVTLADEVAHAPDQPDLHYWQDFPEGSIWHRATRRLAELLSPQWLTPEVRDHLFWLIDRDLDANPKRWPHARKLLAAVYGWWAEGVHLRSQPGWDRGNRTWEQPYVFEMLRWAMPYKNPNAEPMRTNTLDGQLGYALVQITAYVHFRLLDEGYHLRLTHEWSKVNLEFRGPYTRLLSIDDGPQHLVFYPGGNSFFRQIRARWESVVRPFEAELALPGVVFMNEDLSGVDFNGSDLRSAWFIDCETRGATFRRATLQGSFGIPNEPRA